MGIFIYWHYYCDKSLLNRMLLVLLQVDAYMAGGNSGTEDVLSYWANKAETWRSLAKVACNVLGVPAASTSSERCFSIAGRTLDDRRSQLSPDSVDGLIFLHGLKH